MKSGSEHKVKEDGHVKIEGHEYTVLDGDIIHFRFNVQSSDAFGTMEKVASCGGVFSLRRLASDAVSPPAFRCAAASYGY